MNNLSLFRDNFTKDFFNDWASPGFYIKPLHGRSLIGEFAVDIRETDSAYIVEAEMPGLKKEDIKVDIDRDQITITTELKQHDQKVKNERVIQTERYHGSCSRTIRFLSQIDSTASHASYENGVLHLMIPKRANTAGGRLAIN